jgi:hypothetical protein
MIETYFTSGTATAVMLVMIALEVILLRNLIRRAPAFLWGLLAGSMIVLALGAALTQQRFEVIGVLLAIGLVLHLVEIWQWLKLAKRLPA